MSLFSKIGGTEELVSSPNEIIAKTKKQLNQLIKEGYNTFKIHKVYIKKEDAKIFIKNIPIVCTKENISDTTKRLKEALYALPYIYISPKF